MEINRSLEIKGFLNMSQKKRIKLLTLSLIIMNGGLNAKADSTNQIERLKQQILIAEIDNRFDIADSALEHWLSIDNNNIEVLYLQAEINILKGDSENAKKNIAILESKNANDPRLNILKSLFYAYGPNKLKLQQARFLSGNQRKSESISIYQDLFPYGMPTISLDIEYLDMLGYNNGRDNTKAKQILEARIKEYPYIKEYKLAYANLLANSNKSDVKKSLRLYDQLSNADTHSPETVSAWLNAISEIPVENLTTFDIDKLATTFPYDEKVIEKVKDLRSKFTAYNNKIHDPGYQALLKGFSHLDNSEYELAERSFLIAKQIHPKDSQVYLGLGNTKLGQNNYSEAKDFFLQGKKLRGNNAKKTNWDALIAKANYWIELLQIDKLATSNANKQYVIDQYNKKILQDPSEISPYIAIAKIYASTNNIALADEYFIKALGINESNYSALVGRFNLLFDNNKTVQAFTLSDQYNDSQKKVIANFLSDKKLQSTIADAETALIQHNIALAAEKTNFASGFKTQDPWLIFSLANLLNKLNRKADADKYVLDYLKNNILSDEISYAYALYLSKNGRAIDALNEINKINPDKRTIGMIEAQQRLSLNYQFNHIESLLKEDRAKAINYLTTLEENANKEPKLLIKIANTLYDIDVKEHSRKVINKLEYSAQWPISTQLDYARILTKLKDFDKLANLDKKINLKLASNDELEQYNQIIFEYKIDQANKLVAQNKIAQAKEIYLQLLQNDTLFSAIFLESKQAQNINSKNPESTRQLISLWIDEHFDKLVSLDKYSDYPKVKRIQILVDLEQFKQAETAMQELLLDKRSEDRALYIASKSALYMKKWRLAERLCYAALQANKANNKFEENLLTAKIDTTIINEADKKWLYQNSNVDWLTSNVKSNIDELRKKSDGYVTFFPDYRFGTNTSSLAANIEAKLPVNNIGHAIIRVNPVHLEGELQNLNAKDFGTSQLHLSGQNNSTPIATGVGYNVGWMGKNWMVDVGRTPENFLVSDVVGGLRLDGDFNAFSWAINASRRPIRNTVLSYAGLTDPYTQQIWGGARQNGAGFSLGYDDGSAVGVWSNWQYQYINGQNLKDNDKFQGQVGIYGALWKDTKNLSNVDWGLNTLFMHYANNQNEFSFGNGGYFSPQAYASLSLPITLYGRYSDLAYSLRVTGAYSYSKVNDSDYYPNDPILQDQALNSGLTTTYLGSETHAFTYGVSAVIEKRLTDHWSIGGRAQIQRALFYNPSNVGLYLKYDFNEHWDAISTPPKVPNTINDYADY